MPGGKAKTNDRASVFCPGFWTNAILKRHQLSDALLTATLLAVNDAGKSNASISTRQSMASAARRLGRAGLLATLKHDLSVRLDDGSFLLSPATGDPFELDVDRIFDVPDIAGADVSEGWAIHRDAFQARDDISVVVVARCVELAALAASGVTLAQCLLTGAVGELGGFELSAAGETLAGRALQDSLALADLVALGRYGVVAVGADFDAAVDALIELSRVAQVTRDLVMLGGELAPSERQMELSKTAMAELGVGEFAYGCASCNACPRGHLRAVAGRVGAEVGANDEFADAVSRHLRG